MKNLPKIINKFSKYCLVGILNTIGFYLLIVILRSYVSIYSSVLIGHSIMVVFSYVMNNKYVFEFALQKNRFLIISFSLVCFNYVCSYQLSSYGLGDNSIAITIILMTTIMGFLGNYFFNFKGR